MSRGKSERLVATLPRSYADGWGAKLDKRRRSYRAYLQWEARVAEIISDQGGPEGLSHLEIEAIKGVAFDEIIIDAGRVEYFRHGKLNYGVHSQARFSWAGTVKGVLGGPKRKSRTVRRLHDVMSGRSAPEASP